MPDSPAVARPRNDSELMRRTPCGERCLPRHPLAPPPIHKFLTDGRCAFDTTPSTMPFRANKPPNSGPCPATHREVENDGRNGHTECSPVPPPALRANRAKSGQGMGGAPLLITPEQPRAAEVGEWPQMTTEGEAGGRLAASQGRRGALAEELFRVREVVPSPNPTTIAPYVIAPLIATLSAYLIPAKSPVVPAKAVRSLLP